MEETEVPLEKVNEDIEHHAHSAGVGWITWSALLSAVLAVFAAVAALNSGHHANEAMMEQIKSSDKWAFFQAKGIKASILETRAQILKATGHESDVQEKLIEYASEQKELKAAAEEHEHESATHFRSHEIFATAVTLFQIAIAVTAISVLARRRRFLFLALGFGLFGTFFLVQGFWN